MTATATYQDVVDISELDKAAVLAALYNNSRPLGMGILQARGGTMTIEQAQEAISGGDDHVRMFPTVVNRRDRIYFDYLYGRPLKVDLTGDDFNPWGYDRDNGGPGTAARIVAQLRKEGK